MKELASQKIVEEFDEEKIVFYYRRHLNKIQISNQDVNFSVFATIYKKGRFDIKTKGMSLFFGMKCDLDEKNLAVRKGYNYDAIKNFLESDRSNKAKFSYLYKVLSNLLDIGYDAFFADVRDS